MLTDRPDPADGAPAPDPGDPGAGGYARFAVAMPPIDWSVNQPRESLISRAARGTVRPESIAGSRAAAGAIFPAVTAPEIAASWVGIEAVTPDEVPILGPLPGIANLTLAAGFSGHGFALSPSIGQAIAERIIDGEPSVPIDAFAAARFAGGEGAARVPAPTVG